MNTPRSHAPREASIPVRMSKEERDIIERAAIAQGRDRSQFLRFHAMKAARAELAAAEQDVPR